MSARRLLRDSPPAAAARRRKAIAVIRQSGLFDSAWYREQLGDDTTPGDLVTHYVDVGAAAGLSPSPLFVPEWYVATHRHAQSSRYPAFADYLLAGAPKLAAPHPAFDVQHYVREQPAARKHPFGVLGHYVEVGARSGANPHPAFDSQRYAVGQPGLTDPPFVHFARASARLLRNTQGYRHMPRLVDHFDLTAAERWKRKVRTAWSRAGSPSPLVTVIMPTKDRAGEVVLAARSVLDQTYPNFQLIIVDDGSRDETPRALADICRDHRVELIQRETPGGVAIARNTGLARARGDYIAYLDSDNTWKTDFLELMVAFVTTTGVRAAYCVSELLGTEKHQFRAMPFHYPTLVERNYIDCIVLVHERSLLAEVGGFDESLRRMVDWDLLIRIGAVTDLALAPFVGTTYDLWEERPDRISQSEAWGYRYVIKSKHLVDWRAAGSQREAGLTSVIVSASGPRRHLERCLSRLRSHTPDETEIVVVDPGSPVGRFYELQLLAVGDPRVRIVRLSEELPFELATNIGVTQAHGEYVVVLSSDTVVEPGWLPPLRAAIDDGAAAAAPLLLRPSGSVAGTGWAFARHGHAHRFLRGHAGDSSEVRQPGERSGLESSCVAARADDLVEVRGLDAFFVNAPILPDLSMRLANATGRSLRYEPGSVAIQLDASKDTPRTETDLENVRHFNQRWQEAVTPDAAVRWRQHGFFVTDYVSESEGAADELTAYRPIVVHDRPKRPLRWSIKIAAPDVVDRRGWGDHYFAVGLKEALERRGQEVVIDCAGAWYRNSGHLDDVVLVLRGKLRFVPNPSQITLLWLISHPDSITPSEIAASDHVFAASVPFSIELGKKLGRSIEPLLQCTDPRRFGPGEPDHNRVHPVLFVGNSRGIYRPVVRDAIAAGLDLAVYGQGWEGFLPPGVVRDTYVPNADVAATYRAAGVVLNDHWNDMRRHGFLSNRLFDLTACGARVVSDEIVGLSDIFDAVVATYSSPEELADVVRRQLTSAEDADAQRQALAAKIRSGHSFDARVERLIDVAADAVQLRSQD